jgi:hypothetical protein
MIKVLSLLFVAKYAFADLSGKIYVIDQMSEATTRQYAYKNDGSFNCEPGYTGSDCSQKTCPYSLGFVAGKASEWMYTPSRGQEAISWTSDSDGHLGSSTERVFMNQHAYKECGGRGDCDRTTGKCKCYDSFTGRGCVRSTCPNDCSGHGTCQSDYYNLYGRKTVEQVRIAGESTQARFWAAKKFRSCVCDRGFHGFDCSKRTCPKGDDPETECSDQLSTDRQSVKCTGAGAKDVWFSLRFEDQLGGKYRTHPILHQKTETTAGNNKKAIQQALEALPNFAIPSVEIDMTTQSTSSGDFTFQVDFKDGATTNEQKLLMTDTTTTCADSSQPKFTNDVASSAFACTVTRVEPPANTILKESLTCGGRGLCDTSTGICTCFKGYHGDSCSDISTYV